MKCSLFLIACAHLLFMSLTRQVVYDVVALVKLLDGLLTDTLSSGVSLTLANKKDMSLKKNTWILDM